jgi:hypothetical protein
MQRAPHISGSDLDQIYAGALECQACAHKGPRCVKVSD